METRQRHALVGGHVHLQLDTRHLDQPIEHLQELLAVHSILLVVGSTPAPPGGARVWAADGMGLPVSGLAITS
jgi:hypothetical protein